MPARLRQSAGKAPESAEAEKQYDIPGLDLNYTLTWRPGKAIPVADLLIRLEGLDSQLRAYDEDQVDSQKFAPLAQDLASANLLGHKDKGVRAWALSCVVDVLKTCAPEAPFKESQLKDIFTVIINSVIPALADPSNAYNAQHVYILHSLAESQSILLLADIDQPEELINALFTHTFDIFASSTSGAEMEISKSVEYHLKSLLCTVVEEVDLPNDVTDTIISQFLRVDARKPVDQVSKTRKPGVQDQKQANLLLKDYPPAYDLAKAICTTCQDKMTSQVTQYFNAIIVGAGVSFQSKEDSSRRSGLDDSEDEQEGLSELRKAHHLLRELWRACPDVLINVIPQIEAELSADSISLRQLAAETLGDLTAGIGVAGLPPSTVLDPAAYPLPSISGPQPGPISSNPLLNPASPKPFPSIHRTAYQNFLSRRNDKAASVRATWAHATGRILFTVAGGIGLSDDEHSDLVSGLAQMLRDPEERVRLAAIKAMHLFDYQGIVNALGTDGGLSNEGTVLSTLVDRFKDRKIGVREEAIRFGARLWGVASRDLEEGAENVTLVLGDLPNHLINAYYMNDGHTHGLIYQALFDSILPLGFPPIKQPVPQTSAQRRRTKDAGDAPDSQIPDPDQIRARRILTLVTSLDQRAKQVFFAMQAQQTQMRKAITLFLEACEAYNGGIIDDPDVEDKVKKKLKAYIEQISKQFAEPSKMSADLWKFAELHNRRDYQLIRFATSPEHDYRTVQKAIKELNKRIKDSPSNTQSLLDSLNFLLYRSALVVYNRSHVPAIMEVSRTDEHGLALAAHEVLREISSRNPEVLKSQIRALCKELEETCPSATKFEEPGAADSLKACAHFAREYPAEVSEDRKFLTALSNFALYSKSARAAKHAVSIILTVAKKKAMYARDILTKALEDCEHTSPNYLSRLSAISQICMLAPSTADEENDAILKTMVENTLHINLSPSKAEDENAWDDLNEEETQAKELALRAMVNRCRAESDKDNLDEFDKIAAPIFQLLLQLITNDGEITPTENTPPAQRNRLRFIAAKLVLKLCAHKRRCEELVSPDMFISIALVVINPPNPVRTGFTSQVKKYLGQNKLSHRWYTVLFLLAFEPDEELRTSTLTWIRSRVRFFERQQQQSRSADKKTQHNAMESIFARLLSIMIHHPDYPDQASETFDAELLDFSKYLVFYLTAVATEDNLSLIFHIAQRIKQTRDNVRGDDVVNDRLYVLSDLAQAVIRNYADMMPSHAKGVNLLQTWPGSVSLPKSLFKQMPNHDIAQKIAEKNYLPEETALGLEKMMRDYTRSLRGVKALRRPVGVRKRKAEADSDEDDELDVKRTAKKKKVRTTSLPVRKTPKVKKEVVVTASSPALPSRKSGRVSTTVSYVEDDTEDEDGAEARNVDDQRSSRRHTALASDGPSSSPATLKKKPQKQQQRLDSSPPAAADNDNDGDSIMSGAVKNGTNGIHAHEDHDVSDIDDDQVASQDSEGEQTTSPSPSRPKKSSGQLRTATTSESKSNIQVKGKGKGKGKGKSKESLKQQEQEREKEQSSPATRREKTVDTPASGKTSGRATRATRSTRT